MEILAPVGSPEHLIAALDAGADAIYLGGKRFSARKHAGNFSEEELREAIRLSHIKGSAVYITLNTLIGDKEMRALREYVRILGTMALDGVIVQDVGVAAMVREEAPHIPLHGSTQMTVSDLDGVRFLKRLGFRRVVLARELSVDEIRDIAIQTDMEIETFVHGAICVCYSGQCLMSSFIGGRSGNRGDCAQPCRIPYELIDSEGHILNGKKGKYILSMKDMLGLDTIPSLLDAGVDSLKIEGRMKSPEYVYNTVRAYRKALTAAYGKEALDTHSLRVKLEEEFNRGYTTGYFQNHIGGEMMTGLAPGNHGIFAGTVMSQKRDSFLFSPIYPCSQGDVLGISYETERNSVDFVERNKLVWDTNGGIQVFTKIPSKKRGRVYWQIQKDDRRFALSHAENKIPIKAVLHARPNEVIHLVFRDANGHVVSIASEYVAEKAKKRVTTAEEVQEQLGRLGNTWFTLADVEVKNEGCMIPRSVLNGLRQKGIEELEQIRCQCAEATILAAAEESIAFPKIERRCQERSPHITVRTERVEQAHQAIQAGVREVVFGGESFRHVPLSLGEYEEVLAVGRKAGTRIVFALPRVVRQKNGERVKKQFLNLAALGPDAMEIQHPGALEWTHELNVAIPMECGPSFNLFNRNAVREVQKWGISGAYVSQEMTLPQIRDIVKNTNIPVGAYVYGRSEMMISEYCVINAVMTDKDKDHCSAPCLLHSYSLKDENGRVFPVKTDEWCHMHIQNSAVLDMRPYMKDLKSVGITKFCIDVRGLEGDHRSLFQEYINSLDGHKGSYEPKDRESDIQMVTRGHFFRGVR